jgi:hypothetical protein
MDRTVWGYKLLFLPFICGPVFRGRQTYWYQDFVRVRDLSDGVRPAARFIAEMSFDTAELSCALQFLERTEVILQDCKARLK